MLALEQLYIACLTAENQLFEENTHCDLIAKRAKATNARRKSKDQRKVFVLFKH